MNSDRLVRKTLLSAAVAAASLNAGLVSAAQIEEVIVTTQKRAQSLQDVPISVSAFTGSFIEKAQIKSLGPAHYDPTQAITSKQATSTNFYNKQGRVRTVP